MSMITPAPAAKQPTISPVAWAGNPAQCPQWIGYPTRESLPAGLNWSGASEVPAIGARVHIYLNDFGPAEVRAYFHAEGYLGVLCAPDRMPAWLRESSPNVTMGHFFGRELEPRRAMPAANAPQADEPADDDQDSAEYPEHGQRD